MNGNSILEIKRIFAAPPSRVFDAWTTHAHFQAWIGPKGVTCDVPLFEPTVGGRYRIIMKLSDGRTIPVAGVFTAIEPPTRLAFTWGWENAPDHQSSIILTFAGRGADTELTLRQEGLGTVENRDAHGAGWNSALDKLVTYLGMKGTAQ